MNILDPQGPIGAADTAILITKPEFRGLSGKRDNIGLSEARFTLSVRPGDEPASLEAQMRAKLKRIEA